MIRHRFLKQARWECVVFFVVVVLGLKSPDLNFSATILNGLTLTHLFHENEPILHAHAGSGRLECVVCSVCWFPEQLAIKPHIRRGKYI